MPHLNYHFFGRKISFYGSEATGFQRTILFDATQGLFARFSGGRLMPELFESWQCSDQGTLWRFRVKPGLSFHNGRAVDARDVEFSFIAPLISTYRTPEFSVSSSIQSATTLQPGQAYESGMLPGIRVLSDSELEVRFDQPSPDFLEDLALNPAYSLFPREELRTPGFDLKEPSKNSGSYQSWIRHPIGAGSFQIEAIHDGGAEIHLRRIAPPSPSHVSTLRLTVGTEIPPNVDILDRISGLPSVPGNLEKKVLPVPAAIYGVYFNFDREIVRDLRFRKAIQCVLNPFEFSAHFQDGRPSTTVIPSSWPSWEGPRGAADLDQARQVFQELAAEFNLAEVAISTLVKTGDAEPSWVLHLRSRLQQAGLPLKGERKEGGELVLAGFGPSIASPWRLFSLFAEGSGWVSQLNEPDTVYTELLQRLAIAEPGESADLVKRLQARMTEQAYTVPLFETLVSLWVNPRRGIDLGEQGLCFSFDPIRVVD